MGQQVKTENFIRVGIFEWIPLQGCCSICDTCALIQSTMRRSMKHKRSNDKCKQKNQTFFKPQNYLFLVMFGAFVGVAKTPLIHYLTLKTRRERLKMVTFKKGINTQQYFVTDPQVFVSHQ